jgi:hypothetical protein
MGFDKNRLSILGGYNIKNFDIPLLREMLANKKIKSQMLSNMLNGNTVDVYDGGYIGYMLQRINKRT